MNGTADIDSLIAGVETEYPALVQLFGGFFHQDWRAEYSTPPDAASAFMREAAPGAVQAAALELDRLLATALDETALARVLADGFDCNYLPGADGQSSEGWLNDLRETLRPSAA